jgi:acyl-CoA synthetase (AMP-forming)/AMP-acid ligase II
MVADLVRSSLVGFPLEGLLFGGSPSPDSLAERARLAFPSATMSQAYGMTETNSVAVGVRSNHPSNNYKMLYLLFQIAGEDYLARPSSTSVLRFSFHRAFLNLLGSGLPCPVNDIMIMHKDKSVGPGNVGEVWL